MLMPTSSAQGMNNAAYRPQNQVAQQFPGDNGQQVPSINGLQTIQGGAGPQNIFQILPQMDQLQDPSVSLFPPGAAQNGQGIQGQNLQRAQGQGQCQAQPQVQPQAKAQSDSCQCEGEDSNAMQQLVKNFKEFDGNKDGVLQPDELKNAEEIIDDPNGDITGLRANMDELMFANKDKGKGDAAWQGLSKKDLKKIDHQLEEHGVSLNEQGSTLREKVSKERNIEDSPNAFSKFINKMQHKHQ